MKLLRSWPRNPPAGRPHVVDDIPKLMMDDYDYTVLAEPDDDILLIEWDLAVNRQELRLFATLAATSPNSVLVAPYLLYWPDEPMRAPRWSPGYWQGPGHGLGPAVETGAPWCNLFALGLTYLPRKVIRGYLDARQPGWGRMCDVNLSEWHFQAVAEQVPITWNVRPVHLHYVPPVAEIELLGRWDHGNGSTDNQRSGMGTR